MPGSASFSWRRILCAFAILGLAGPFLGLVLADLLPDRWWNEAFEHPRPQYLLCGTLAAAALAILLRRRVVWFAGLVPLWALIGMLPALPGRPDVPGAGTGLQVVTANVHSDNPDPVGAIAALVAMDADVVAVLEPTMDWEGPLGALRAVYPQHREILRGDNFGIALYARRGRITTWWPDGVEVPGLLLANDGIELLAVHPPPPFSPAYHAAWQGELAAISAWAASRPAAVVIGDLNATPWCGGFRRLCADGGLAGQGGLAMWVPTWMWPTPLAAPIDHVLAGPALRVSGHRVGPDIGSDHRPVRARIVRAVQIAERPAQPLGVVP